MQIPVETKPALWGVVGGAIGMAIVGFTWGGWVTGGSAEENAARRSSAAVVAALAPVCVDRFRRAGDATANLVALKQIDSWQQATYIEKGGWATMPGAESPDSDVARACAELLGKK